jgi:hypothetical protein
MARTFGISAAHKRNTSGRQARRCAAVPRYSLSACAAVANVSIKPAPIIAKRTAFAMPKSPSCPGSSPERFQAQHAFGLDPGVDTGSPRKMRRRKKMQSEFQFARARTPHDMSLATHAVLQTDVIFCRRKTRCGSSRTRRRPSTAITRAKPGHNGTCARRLIRLSSITTRNNLPAKKVLRRVITT